MQLEEIIIKCKKRDRKAQEILFRQYKDVLYFISLKYCRNEAEAEDNLHDTFITIFEKIKTYKATGTFEGWMKRIAIYKAISKYKANKMVNVDYKDDLLEDTTFEEETEHLSVDSILKLVQDLPDQYRLVFNMYQLDGFRHKEIADLLGISESTSKSNYHRAKKILKEKIIELQTSPIKL